MHKNQHLLYNISQYIFIYKIPFFVWQFIRDEFRFVVYFL